MPAPALPKNLASEAQLALLDGLTVGVLGFGAQGAAHAANLRDSGVAVVVGLRPGQSCDRARADGFVVQGVADVARAANFLICALPDEAAPQVICNEVRPHLRAGQTIGFLHGFVVRFGLVEFPADVDVVLLAPKGQGRAVRSEFLAGRGVGALIAVHQDATGHARKTALGWAAAIGAHRTAILETTFSDECETDLFGEQAVLCGGVSELIHAAYDTLVDAGYPPELAYLECCHELKLVVDLIYEFGISGMRARISGTARYGDLTRGTRLIDEHVREKMREILNEIRTGRFAREWVSEHESGRERLSRLLAAGQAHPLEATGARVRRWLWGGKDPGTEK